jgi:hypothetical protein
MARTPRVSQKDRLERLRAEKAAAEAKKTDGEEGEAAEGSVAPAKPAKPAAKPRAKAAPKQRGRKVVVWAVLDATALKPVATFPYKDKEAAEAHCAKLTRDKKKPFLVQPLKQTAD